MFLFQQQNLMTQLLLPWTGDGTITLFNFETNESTVLASGFKAPTHIINYEDRLLVSDRELGELILVDEEGNKSTLIRGLNSPEGLSTAREFYLCI